MGLLYLTYLNLIINHGLMPVDNIFPGSISSSSASPFHLILYSIVAIGSILLLVILQTRTLVKTRKLLREKEQALNLIEMQKGELELKDKDITDSLIYAQRIQEALLPSEAYFRKHFEDSFILFKPKNIVSGDFIGLAKKVKKYLLWQQIVQAMEFLGP